MNEAILGLVRLQELDKALDALRQHAAKIAPRRAAVAARRAALVAQHESSKKTLTDAQVQKKNLEMDIDTKDQVIRKSSGELNSVKSNDAYKALLTQIDAAKKEKSAIEDQVLVLMETIDALQKSAKAADAEHQTQRAALDAEDAALNAEEAEDQSKADAKQGERDSYAAGLPRAARERYESIQRGRPGFLAVVPLQDMICGGCRTRLTASLLNEVMKGKDLVACESCSRLLYIPPKPADAAVPQ
jgi:predicted  nucleic acid-binding Zn-ribbon protein